MEMPLPMRPKVLLVFYINRAHAYKPALGFLHFFNFVSFVKFTSCLCG